MASGTRPTRRPRCRLRRPGPRPPTGTAAVVGDVDRRQGRDRRGGRVRRAGAAERRGARSSSARRRSASFSQHRHARSSGGTTAARRRQRSTRPSCPTATSCIEGDGVSIGGARQRGSEIAPEDFAMSPGGVAAGVPRRSGGLRRAGDGVLRAGRGAASRSSRATTSPRTNVSIGASPATRRSASSSARQSERELEALGRRGARRRSVDLPAGEALPRRVHARGHRPRRWRDRLRGRAVLRAARRAHLHHHDQHAATVTARWPTTMAETFRVS